MTTTLRAARLRRGMTQDDLASKTGIDQTHISSIEIGRRYPSDETVKRLAKALRITPSALQFERPQPSRTISTEFDKVGHSASEAV